MLFYANARIRVPAAPALFVPPFRCLFDFEAAGGWAADAPFQRQFEHIGFSLHSLRR